jgi:ribosome assembly protein RRB1
MQESKVA